MSHNGAPSCAAFFKASAPGLYVCALRGAFGEGNSTFAPASAVTASFTAFGGCGEQPEPAPAAPPLLIITMVPVIKTPAGIDVDEISADLQSERCSGLNTSVVPDLRWISVPASAANFMPTFCSRSCPVFQRHCAVDLFILVALDVEWLSPPVWLMIVFFYADVVVVQNRLKRIILDTDVKILFAVNEDLFFALLVIDSDFVKAAASL